MRSLKDRIPLKTPEQLAQESLEEGRKRLASILEADQKG
jgi:hypothetical protein